MVPKKKKYTTLKKNNTIIFKTQNVSVPLIPIIIDRMLQGIRINLIKVCVLVYTRILRTYFVTLVGQYVLNPAHTLLIQN